MNNETSYFLFQIISFKNYFYVSLGNIFYCFCGGPLVVEALGNCPVCPPLNPALDGLTPDRCMTSTARRGGRNNRRSVWMNERMNEWIEWMNEYLTENPQDKKGHETTYSCPHTAEHIQVNIGLVI